MIRAARESDVAAIVAMGLAFAADDYREYVVATPAAMEQLVRAVLVSDTMAACVSECDGELTGMIGMSTYVNPFSGDVTATEIAWWVTPDARGSRDAIRLLHWAEAWARAKGATRFQMIAPNDRVGAFYERLGFRKVETHYQRAL